MPFNGTPGETYDKWERALLNAGAKADDRGYSISDHLTPALTNTKALLPIRNRQSIAGLESTQGSYHTEYTPMACPGAMGIMC